MKKLMIAAAAAAMIGGVEAANYYYYPRYSFSASIKTTKAAQGKASSKTYTVNLGKASDGCFWYYDGHSDSPIEFYDDYEGFSFATQQDEFDVAYGCIVDRDDNDKIIATNAVKYTYKNGKFKGATLELNGLDDETKEAIAAAFGFDGTDTEFNVKSANKWCKTFTYKHTTEAQCYRTAASKTFKGYAHLECCDEDPYISVYTTDYDGMFSGELATLRFGGDTLDKSTKVELYANLNGNYIYGSEDNGALAGQGTWGKRANWNENYGWDQYGITSANGNIAFASYAPDCESCCLEEGELALAFVCDDDGEWVSEGDNVDTGWTACFGTWTLKWSPVKEAY